MFSIVDAAGHRKKETHKEAKKGKKTILGATAPTRKSKPQRKKKATNNYKKRKKLRKKFGTAEQEGVGGRNAGRPV